MEVGYGEGSCPLPRKILSFFHQRWCILMKIATDMQQENARLQNCASGSTSDYSSTPFQREVNISEERSVKGLGTKVTQRGPGAEHQ